MISWFHGTLDVVDRTHQDDERIYRAFGQHTPVIDYGIEGRGATTLTVEADIEVEIEQGVTLTDINETYTERTTDVIIIENR